MDEVRETTQGVDVKEHPILFSGPMVRAILDGSKTQTRRVVTPRNSTIGSRIPWASLDFASPAVRVDDGDSKRNPFCPYDHCQYLHVPFRDTTDDDMGETMHRVYPRFVPGDLLWVREPALVVGHTIEYHNSIATYRFTDGVTSRCRIPRRLESDIGAPPMWVYKCQGVPNGCIREMSRLTLRITDVRVQRVQEITLGDVVHEGYPDAPKEDRLFIPELLEAKQAMFDWFIQLWDAINAKRDYSWESNPLVWALTFERVTPRHRGGMSDAITSTEGRGTGKGVEGEKHLEISACSR